MKSKWLGLFAGLFAVSTTLFPAHSSRAVNIVMSPDPAIITGEIDDGVSIVGGVAIFWTLLGVDPTFARYTYKVAGAFVGQALPNSIPGDEDFVIRFNVVQEPSICCAQDPEFANVSNANMDVTAGSRGDDLNWFLAFEPLAPTFSFDVSHSVVVSEEFDPTDPYPVGSPVLLTGQSMSCTLDVVVPPFSLPFCGSESVSFRDTDLPLVKATDPRFGQDSVTVDTSTNLAWLDVDLSEGRSFMDVASELGPGGDFSGYRFATPAEISNLFDTFGFTEETISPAPLTSMFFDLFGVTSSQDGNPEIFGWASNAGPIYGLDFFLGGLGGTYGVYRGDVLSQNPAFAFPGTGSWLVRQTSEPQVLLLLGLALICLRFARRCKLH